MKNRLAFTRRSLATQARHVQLSRSFTPGETTSTLGKSTRQLRCWKNRLPRIQSTPPKRLTGWPKRSISNPNLPKHKKPTTWQHHGLAKLTMARAWATPRCWFVLKWIRPTLPTRSLIAARNRFRFTKQSLTSTAIMRWLRSRCTTQPSLHWNWAITKPPSSNRQPSNKPTRRQTICPTRSKSKPTR